MSSRKTNQRFIAWSIVIIILLLATSAYLWWNSIQLNNQLNLHKEELAAVEITQGQLEKDYDLALNSLDELKGDNAELNAMIEAQKAELKSQKDKISNLIWKTKKLDEARAEIEKLKSQALSYVEEINKLKTEKESLVAENQELKTKTVDLESTIEVISGEKESINRERDSILQVKERLKKENVNLSIKATKASVIDVLEIDVTGYAIKESGKLSKKRKANNVELLKVCFKLIPNEIAEGDTEMFYLRLISPTGETLYKTQLGAGIFTKSEDGTQTKYTIAANFNMPLSEEVVCINYEHKETLPEGLYLVEIYNKGYLAGSGSFTLK